MYVITAHQRYRRTDGRTDAKRWHDRSIAILAWSGKNEHIWFNSPFSILWHFNILKSIISYYEKYTLN